MPTQHAFPWHDCKAAIILSPNSDPLTSDLWVMIPLLLATFVGQLTDSQVPDQFELLAPIGPAIPVVCEHSHV